MNESSPKKLGLLFLAAVTILLIFGANAWKSNLKIAQINVEGNRIVGLNEIVQLSHVQVGTLLYKTDLLTIQQSIMTHYYIKDAIIERNVPNTIHIQVTERTPIAMINSSQTLYLDEEGIVLPRSISHRLLDLPVISGIEDSDNLKLGSSLQGPDIKEALQILAVMRRIYRNMYHNISEIQLRNGGDIVMYSTEGGIPIIFGHNDLADKIVKLETFWNTVVLTRGARNLAYIDLRFQDQIVARWNNEPSKARVL